MIYNHDLLLGVIDKTVFYIYTNLSVVEIVGGVRVTFDRFNFLSPVGERELLDIDLFFGRDLVLDKVALGIVTVADGLEVVEVLEGESYDLSLGLEGDIIFSIMIPAEGEIIVHTKEVAGE